VTDPVLEIRGLRTSFRGARGPLMAVRGVDLDLHAGEVLGLIGESGSGKTVTGLSILRLLPSVAVAEADLLRFQGKDLRGMSDAAFRALRGVHLAMVFQNPPGAFNPAKSIGWHFAKVFARRAARSDAAAGREAVADWRAAAQTLLAEVGIAQPARLLRLYPHQLSGGMLQRVLIGMVLALEPEVIIADEPTTNLDNIVERQILALFRRLQRKVGAAIIFITHDMAIAAALCDRIAVMYAGEIVESGPTREVFASPRHPYAQGLIETATALSAGGRLREIPGELPGPAHHPPGCLFAARHVRCIVRG
jgi:peptide/nickel transport system ATP-binding protein